MGKIGILTYHRSINYGAFLQSYSLANEIQRTTGHQVEIIDYQTYRKYRNYKRQIVISTDLSIMGPYRNYRRYAAFNESLSKLPLSPEPIITDHESELQKAIAGRYDILVTGSDAVFNFRNLVFPNAYWLHGFEDVQKMSYAASAHGMDFQSILPEQYSKMAHILKDFSYIGARDQETINMIKRSDASLEVHRNCDPTVFLDVNSYSTNLDKKLYTKYKLPRNKKMIGIMVYDRELGKRIRQRYGNEYLIVALYRSNPYADVYLYDLDPFEWSQVFSKFELLFTKYFHGTLLSLKNTTPTITFDYTTNVELYDTKLKDLLYRLDLSECFFARKDLKSDEQFEKMFSVSDQILRQPEDVKDKIVKGLEKESRYRYSFLNRLDNM